MLPLPDPSTLAALAPAPSFLADLLPGWVPAWITQHNALDLGAAITGLIGVWRLGSKHKDGFLWGSVSCLFWVAFNLRVDSPPGVAFNAVWIVLNARGLLRWHRDHKAPPATP